MAVFYYLISSLPMLSYDETPKITSEKFIESCEDSLSSNDFSELRNIQLVPPADYSFFSNKEVRKWYDWDTSLRNALVRLRAGKVAFESEGDLRTEGDFFSEINKGVQEAMSRTSPLEKEEYLDQMRWARLTDLESGHNYDFSVLCLYRLKLMLCEKREHWDRVHGNENFDKIIDNIYGSWSPGSAK